MSSRGLTLPSLAYADLRASIATGREKKLAYETYARVLLSGTVEVRHHGSVIAELSHDRVRVTNAGYSSSTTRDRLHTIMHDNMGNRYGVTQQNYDQCLIEWPADGGKREIRAGFSEATFMREGDAFTLTRFNGEKI